MGRTRGVVQRSNRRGMRVGELAVVMGMAIVTGGLLGAATVAVDRVWLTPAPFELGDLESSRSLLTAVAGGLITVAVFSLWMRTVVVGLVSEHFSPRTLVSFLEDRFQRNLLASMSAGLVAVLVVLMGLPGEEEDVLAPVLGTLLAVGIAVAALAGVLGAIQHATRSLSLPELVSRLANDSLEVLSRQPEGRVELHGTPPTGQSLPVHPPASGWVTGLDTSAMLAACPPGAAVHLQTRVGAFVTPRSVLAQVSLAEAEADARPDLDAVADAVRLARTRSPDLDLAFAIGQLLDVGAYALQGSTDTATGHEVLVHLGAVLEAVVARGVPLRHDADAEGRRVFDEAGWGAADHVQLCTERLRDPASRDPESARHLLRMLRKVRSVAEEVDDRAVVSEVGRQVETILALAEANGMLERDRRHLERIAETFVGDDAAG